MKIVYVVVAAMTGQDPSDVIDPVGAAHVFESVDDAEAFANAMKVPTTLLTVPLMPREPAPGWFGTAAFPAARTESLP